MPSTGYPNTLPMQCPTSYLVPGLPKWSQLPARRSQAAWCAAKAAREKYCNVKARPAHWGWDFSPPPHTHAPSCCRLSGSRSIHFLFQSPAWLTPCLLDRNDWIPPREVPLSRTTFVVRRFWSTGAAAHWGPNAHPFHYRILFYIKNFHPIALQLAIWATWTEHAST